MSTMTTGIDGSLYWQFGFTGGQVRFGLGGRGPTGSGRSAAASSATGGGSESAGRLAYCSTFIRTVISIMPLQSQQKLHRTWW